MPTMRYGKVRHLLKSGLARVVKRTPFTIRLNYDTSEYTQPVSLGIDAGSRHIGISASTKDKVLYEADVELRNDIVELLSTRREARRTRRNRKTRTYNHFFTTITYILFGMCYTAVQIPYGSLASAVTANEKERSKLSIFRAVGGAIGGTPIIIINMFAFYNKEGVGQVVDYPVLITGVCILAACSFVAMFLAYKFNKESNNAKNPSWES